MLNVLYIILGALGLGFIVFIHELGHYIAARRVGMQVEVFSIGFGKPFFTWTFQGVKWQLCYLLFGGYVKIAGMEREKDKEPSEIENGFFGKSPLARIKVALAGPLVNIVFAFIAFSLIFALGGRQKPFSEYTKIIGYVDPNSAAYQKGLRPGDILKEIDGRPYKGSNDLLYSSVVKQPSITIKGDHVHYVEGTSTPFEYTLDLYPYPNASSDFHSFGVLAPAMWMLYNPLGEQEQSPMVSNSSVRDSGIKYGDRILWIDGEFIFSVPQLHSMLNNHQSLFTIKRDKQIFLVRVPRIPITDLRLSKNQYLEFDDWQHEIGLKRSLDQMIFIPYAINSHCYIEEQLPYLNQESQLVEISSKSSSPLDQPLQKGDRILAVDGKPIVSAFQFLKEIQEKRLQVIVDRSPKSSSPISYKDEDAVFYKSVNWAELSPIITTIGLDDAIHSKGDLHLLKPIIPLKRQEIERSLAKQQQLDDKIANYRKKALDEKDPEQQQQMLDRLSSFQDQLFLGIVLQDQMVTYNPPPWVMFKQVCADIFRTIGALFSGSLNPKWMSGPVGFIQVMHHGWSVGFKEAIYWLGMISLGLGFSNLLPIPVLDGGYICFALWEIITRKPIKAKVMERMIIPFVIMLILFFVFVTYHDISRLITRLF